MERNLDAREEMTQQQKNEQASFEESRRRQFYTPTYQEEEPQGNSEQAQKESGYGKLKLLFFCALAIMFCVFTFSAGAASLLGTIIPGAGEVGVVGTLLKVASAVACIATVAKGVVPSGKEVFVGTNVERAEHHATELSKASNQAQQQANRVHDAALRTIRTISRNIGREPSNSPRQPLSVNPVEENYRGR